MTATDRNARVHVVSGAYIVAAGENGIEDGPSYG